MSTLARSNSISSEASSCTDIITETDSSTGLAIKAVFRIRTSVSSRRLEARRKIQLVPTLASARWAPGKLESFCAYRVTLG